jgi:D-tyrosyl-tRNA(Tyr) deacylase
MRALIQRVSEAEVRVNGAIISRIGLGMLVLVGFEEADNQADIDWMAKKLVQIRLYPDEHGVMNRNVSDVSGEILAVSQFTLYASCKKGNRPSWSRAARGELSQPLFDRFIDTLTKVLGRHIGTGKFGSDMQVSLANEGPVTLMLDSKNPE